MVNIFTESISHDILYRTNIGNIAQHFIKNK